MKANVRDTRWIEGPLSRYLSDLVSINSVFSNPQGIEEALCYCEREITRVLPSFCSRRDSAGNLISFSDQFDRSRNAVLLSAHVDTVDADALEWKSSRFPFVALETDTHIIGRGANDCKAGVAMMLLMTHMKCQLPIDNIVLLFSYREEGNREKTAVRIGEELGHSIPLSDRRNLLLCLENTVGLTGDSALLGAYDCEPCNAFISITGQLHRIRSFLLERPQWRPIAIRPASPEPHGRNSRMLAGVSGHAATLPNGENVLYRAVMDKTIGLIEGGDEAQASIVDNRVLVRAATVPVEHVAVLNYRGLTSISDLRRSIEGIEYKEHFPFHFAAGSDRRHVVNGGLAKPLIEEMGGRDISVTFSCNPGRSDASAIWNATSECERLEIITIGPGTRSHLDNGVLRRTHGPDEGFHKESGRMAIGFIVDLISRYLEQD